MKALLIVLAFVATSVAQPPKTGVEILKLGARETEAISETRLWVAWKIDVRNTSDSDVQFKSVQFMLLDKDGFELERETSYIGVTVPKGESSITGRALINRDAWEQVASFKAHLR